MDGRTMRRGIVSFRNCETLQPSPTSNSNSTPLNASGVAKAFDTWVEEIAITSGGGRAEAYSSSVPV